MGQFLDYIAFHLCYNKSVKRLWSNAKNRVLTSFYFAKVKVKGWGQVQRSRLNLWHAAVYIGGSALSSETKSNKNHYQSKVFSLCVCNQWADNCVDAIDWLLIMLLFWHKYNSMLSLTRCADFPMCKQNKVGQTREGS